MPIFLNCASTDLAFPLPLRSKTAGASVTYARSFNTLARSAFFSIFTPNDTTLSADAESNL